MPQAADTAWSLEQAHGRPLIERLPARQRTQPDQRPSSWWKSALKTMGATVAYAVAHSLLASSAAKAAASKLAGERPRNAIYRPLFNLQAVAGFAVLAWYIRRLPSRELYDVHGPAAWFLRATQAGFIGIGIVAARQIGFKRVLGLQSLAAWWAGEREVSPEPEAQGPLYDSEQGIMLATGPFRYSRHPLNFVPIPVLWLNPHMTTNLAAFAAVATLYFMLGSAHEEHRLREAYGDAYEQYRHSEVPFLLPH